MAQTNGHNVHQDNYSTRAIHVGSDPDPSTGAVVPSLSVATTFRQDGINKLRSTHEYARSSNPTRSSLEELVTSLETAPLGNVSDSGRGDESGGASLVFSSGSAATAAMCGWASLQEAEGGAGGQEGGGGHVLAVNDVVCPLHQSRMKLMKQYGGTARFLTLSLIHI